MAVKNWKVFVLITLSGLIMCMFIGFILAGSRALLPGHIAFQFTGYGFFCSLLYTTLKFSTTRDYLFVAVIFYLFDVILLGHGNPSKFIIHGSYSLFLVLSIFIYVRKLEQEAQNGFLANVFSLSGIPWRVGFPHIIQNLSDSFNGFPQYTQYFGIFFHTFL